jgi:oligoendopeptidase F
MENNLIVQLGSVLLTLVVAMVGLFKGLIPQLLGSFEKRLADKDTVLAHQNQALDEVCAERKELTERFLRSLQELVLQNATSMSELTSSLAEFRKQVRDEHDEQHLNHRDILNLLQDKKPKVRRSAKKAAEK